MKMMTQVAIQTFQYVTWCHGILRAITPQDGRNTMLLKCMSCTIKFFSYLIGTFHVYIHPGTVSQWSMCANISIMFIIMTAYEQQLNIRWKLKVVIMNEITIDITMVTGFMLNSKVTMTNAIKCSSQRVFGDKIIVIFVAAKGI